MEIIKATSNDLPLIMPLFDGYRQFYEQPSDLEASSRYITDRLDKSESVIFLVYENLNGKKEGIGFAQLYATFSSVTLKKFWVLHDLYVKDNFRKQGIAKILINKCKEMAHENAPLGIVIESRISNQSAQHLFDAVGFVKEGEHYFYYLEN